MKGSIRVSARTLDDAITEASIQLGVTSDRMEYNVIEKGSAGFLGIGSRQAVIRAWKKKVEEPEPVKEKKEFRKEPRKEGKKEGRKENRKDNSRKKDKKYEKRNTNRPVEEKKEQETEPVSQPQEPEVKKELEIAVVTEETKKICEEFLYDVLKAMDMGDVEIISSIDEDGALSMELKGSNMGILIGKRGQTLDSLQYLTNRVANKHQEGYVRVKLDTEDYRRRRKATLENLAKNIAYKVKRTRRPVALEPMNPYERRIIHSALQADDRVSTHSEGEEPYRRVVVTPNRR